MERCEAKRVKPKIRSLVEPFKKNIEEAYFSAGDSINILLCKK
jgi:hypothetical protein